MTNYQGAHVHIAVKASDGRIQPDAEDVNFTVQEAGFFGNLFGGPGQTLASPTILSAHYYDQLSIAGATTIHPRGCYLVTTPYSHWVCTGMAMDFPINFPCHLGSYQEYTRCDGEPGGQYVITSYLQPVDAPL